MFLFTFFRSALMNAFPSTPTPGDCSRPRAKITSTCGQAADADGTTSLPGSTEGPTSRPAATSTAAVALTRPRRIRRLMVLRSRRIITSPMLADELTLATTERCRLQPACDEVGRRVDRTARVVGGPVRGDIFPVGLADRVTAVAEIDRLRTPDRGDRQRGAEFGARIAEGDNRRDEVRRVGRERVVETQDRHGYRSDDVHDSRAL